MVATMDGNNTWGKQYGKGGKKGTIVIIISLNTCFTYIILVKTHNNAIFGPISQMKN